MAESENGNFFEVTEEEDFDPTGIENNCDMLETSSLAVRTKSFSEEVPVSNENSLVTNDTLYFDHTENNHEDLATASAISYDKTKSQTSWVTYEDTHDIRQSKWSNVSSSSSSSISVMSTTSSSTSYSS